MKKNAFATQIPEQLKKKIDHLCAEKGYTISHLTTEALEEKIASIREDEALTNLALERLAEQGEYSLSDFKKTLKSLG